mgnify:CR=1 FL=1
MLKVVAVMIEKLIFNLITLRKVTISSTLNWTGMIPLRTKTCVLPAMEHLDHFT